MRVTNCDCCGGEILPAETRLKAPDYLPEQIKDLCLDCHETFEKAVAEVRKNAKAEELLAITQILKDRTGTMRGKQIQLKNDTQTGKV